MFSQLIQRFKRNLILLTSTATVLAIQIGCNSKQSFSALEESKALQAELNGEEIKILSWSPESELVLVPASSGSTMGVTLQYSGKTPIEYEYLLDGVSLSKTSAPFFHLQGQVVKAESKTFTVKASNGKSAASHDFSIVKNKIPTIFAQSPSENLVVVDCAQKNRIFSAEFRDPEESVVNYRWMLDGQEVDDSVVTEVKAGRARAIVSYDCTKAVDSTLSLIASDGTDETVLSWRYIKQEVSESGTVGNSAVSFNPVSYDFGQLSVFSGNSSISFSLTNTASKPIFFSNFTGENTHFSVTATTCPVSPTVWAAGSNCTVTVKFNPKSPGLLVMNLTANYKAELAGNNFISTMGVSGTGVSPLNFAGIQSVSDVRHNRMTLNWATTANASSFTVFRLNGSDLVFMKTVVNTGYAVTSTTVTDLTPSTNYIIRVRATDVFGNQDANTADLSRSTSANNSPAISFSSAYSFYSGTSVGPIDASDVNTNSDADQDDDVLSYSCTYTNITAGQTGACTSLLNEGGGNPSFNTATGVFSGWKPLHSQVGNSYKIEIAGTDPYSASSNYHITKTVLQGIPSVPIITSVSTARSNNRTQTITGTGDPNSTVVLYYGANCANSLASGTTDGAGQFSISVTFPAVDAVYSVWGKGLNVIGNYSSCSATSTNFTLDTTPPTPLSLSSSIPSSPSSGLTPTIYGTTEAGATVRLFTDAACATLLATTTAAGNGGFQFSRTVNAYSTTVFYVRALDDLNNITACGAAGTTLSYTSYRIPAGAALFEGTTNTDGSYLNRYYDDSSGVQTRAALTWNSTKLYDPSYYEYNPAFPGNITIITGGSYYISVAVPMSLDANVPAGKTLGADASTRVQVYVNGAPNLYAMSEVFISNLNSQHQQGSGTINYLLSNLSSGDVITVRTEGTAGRGKMYTVTGQAGNANYEENITISSLQRSSVYLQFVDTSTESVFSALATSVNGGGVNLTAAAATALNWNPVAVIDTNVFSHNTSSNSHQITLKDQATYYVTLNAPCQTAVAWTTPRLDIVVDGTIVGSAMQGISRWIANSNAQANRHIYQSVHWAGLVTTTAANQILTITSMRDNGVAGPANILNGASLTIRKIPSLSGSFIAKATQTKLQSTSAVTTNFSTASLSDILWEAVTQKDSAVYSHSTSTAAHQITILQRGDYLYIYNGAFLYACTGATRINPVIQLRKNGAVIPGAETKSNLITGTSNTHCRGSGTSVLLLQDLQVNDVLSVTAVDEGAGSASVTGLSNSLPTIVLMKK